MNTLFEILYLIEKCITVLMFDLLTMYIFNIGIILAFSNGVFFHYVVLEI